MIGHTRWTIAEGYLPPDDDASKSRALVSHEAFCVLNPNDRDCDIEMTIYYGDREPVGPYRMKVAARRTVHFRFNDLSDPEPIPVGTDYASVITASVPIVVQHTRLDSRSGTIALMTTMAYPG
ncbi:sensory rhodopsin transducer [Asticcacaulis solisilvae]|uniref:sensory rhodopsin transducer n=1 Tax=Asticcacaulis solisilvae TaxID=1217274 RepID=UPI003FD8299B